MKLYNFINCGHYKIESLNTSTIKSKSTNMNHIKSKTIYVIKKIIMHYLQLFIFLNILNSFHLMLYQKIEIDIIILIKNMVTITLRTLYEFQIISLIK